MIAPVDNENYSKAFTDKNSDLHSYVHNNKDRKLQLLYPNPKLSVRIGRLGL